MLPFGSHFLKHQSLWCGRALRCHKAHNFRLEGSAFRLAPKPRPTRSLRIPPPRPSGDDEGGDYIYSQRGSSGEGSIFFEHQSLWCERALRSQKAQNLRWERSAFPRAFPHRDRLSAETTREHQNQGGGSAFGQASKPLVWTRAPLPQGSQPQVGRLCFSPSIKPKVLKDLPRYRGTSLIRNNAPSGLNIGTMPRALWRSWGGAQFVVSEIPL